MSLFDAAATRYVNYTESASTCIRALALGTIAVAWLFLDTGDSDPNRALGLADHHRWLEVSLIFAVLALVVDAAQYLAGAYLYQLLSTTIEEVFKDPALPSDPARRRQSWDHAARIGLVVRILEAANPATVAGDAVAQTSEAQDAIRDLHDPSKVADPDVVKLAAMTGQEWSPGSYVRIIQRFFWGKSLAAGVGGVSLLGFCLFAIL